MAGTRKTTHSQEPRRSDQGSYKYTYRDETGLRLTAEMKYMPLDLLGQWLAPHLSPALEEPAHPKGTHGGKRDDLGWPQDAKKRLHATTELVRRWVEKMHYADLWKPWDEEVAWVRITEAGLRNLGLDWNEIPWPDDRTRLLRSGHDYQVNTRRVALARGGSDAPRHTWTGERELYIQQRRAGIDAERAHRPDGVLTLHENGAFDGPHKKNGDIENIPMQAGQRIAIETELTRKGLERLGKGILPSLLRTYDFAWYFCQTQTVYQTIIDARSNYLTSNEERKRIRILLLEEEPR